MQIDESIIQSKLCALATVAPPVHSVGSFIGFKLYKFTQKLFDLLTWKLDFVFKSLRARSFVIFFILCRCCVWWIANVLRLNQLIDGACGQKKTTTTTKSKTKQINQRKRVLDGVNLCMDLIKRFLSRNESVLQSKRNGVFVLECMYVVRYPESIVCSYSIWCVWDDGETYC